jgi:pyridoxal biosynthesis lyase PdxS
MIPTIVNAVRHMRAMGDIRPLGSLLEVESVTAAKDAGPPFELAKWVADHGRPPVRGVHRRRERAASERASDTRYSA